MRLPRTLFWGMMLLWIFVAMWWAGSRRNFAPIRGALKLENTGLPGFHIADSTWNINSTNNFRFSKSGSVPVITDDMAALLDSFIRYANSHPYKSVSINGCFGLEEMNTSAFENLGLARADGIKNWLIANGMVNRTIQTVAQPIDWLVFSPEDTLVGGISIMLYNAVPVTDDGLESRMASVKSISNLLSFDTDFSNFVRNGNNLAAKKEE